MTIRGGGDPSQNTVIEPFVRMGRCLGASLLKRMAASWSGPTRVQPNTRLRREVRAHWRAPLGSHPPSLSGHILEDQWTLDGLIPIQSILDAPPFRYNPTPDPLLSGQETRASGDCGSGHSGARSALGSQCSLVDAFAALTEVNLPR